MVPPRRCGRISSCASGCFGCSAMARAIRLPTALANMSGVRRGASSSTTISGSFRAPSRARSLAGLREVESCFMLQGLANRDDAYFPCTHTVATVWRLSYDAPKRRHSNGGSRCAVARPPTNGFFTQSVGPFGIDLMDEAEAGQRDPRDRLGAALRKDRDWRSRALRT